MLHVIIAHLGIHKHGYQSLLERSCGCWVGLKTQSPTQKAGSDHNALWQLASQQVNNNNALSQYALHVTFLLLHLICMKADLPGLAWVRLGRVDAVASRSKHRTCSRPAWRARDKIAGWSLTLQ